jgi:hypothetical protein
VSVSGVPNSRTPGRRSQYILHGGANICGFFVWKLRHVTLDWNFEVRFSENLFTPGIICMCAWICVCVCVCRYNHSTAISGGFCERGNETVFLQCSVLNDQLRNCYLPKKDSAPWSSFLYVMYVKAGPSSRAKAQVCGRSPAEIGGSNPTGGMGVCLLWVLCIFR